MYSFLLAILLAASFLTHSTSLVEDFNKEINGYFQETKKTESPEVNWQKEVSPLAVKQDAVNFPSDAKSIYAIDLSNGQVLENKNENTRLPVASLTKLMTAYVILKEEPLDKELTVPAFSIRADDSLMGVKPGEVLTVRNLFTGMLINSGGDAAQALAINNAGSNQAFVVKMNTEAEKLNLDNTHFDNPVGWDSTSNYSSAKDIAILARILLNNQFFASTVSKKTDTVTSKGGRTISLSNTNLLLNNNDIVGVKTGYTYGAGECLVNLKVTNGHQLMTVILGSGDRFGQTRGFLDWINSHFSW